MTSYLHVKTIICRRDIIIQRYHELSVLAYGQQPVKMDIEGEMHDNNNNILILLLILIIMIMYVVYGNNMVYEMNGRLVKMKR